PPPALPQRSRSCSLGPYVDFRVQRAMHRALVGDLHHARALLRRKIAFETDLAVDAVDLAFLGLALGAIGRVDLVVLEQHRDARERDLLQVGIEADGHGGAGAERSEQILVRAWPAAIAADRDRLVGEVTVLAGDHL